MSGAQPRRLYRPPWRIDLTVRPSVRSPLSAARLADAIAAAASAAGAPAPGVIGLILADDRELARLNRTAMGHRGPTDVLSFPLLPPSAFPPHPGAAATASPAEPPFALPPGSRRWLGEIVVSVPRAAAQADAGRGGQDGRQRWTTADELRLLVTHGTLHLCGWDHADPVEGAAMRALERRLLGLPERPTPAGRRERRAGPLPLPTLPPAAAARVTRLVRDVLRLEDVVLIVWVAVQPIVLRAGGHAGAASGGLDLLDGHDPLLGLGALAAVAGALVCLATRPLDPATGQPAAAAERGTIGPLTGGLLLATAIGCQNLFGTAEAGFGVALVAIVVASLLPGVLPAIRVPYRRVLVAPYVLLSASLFNGLMGQIGGLFDVHQLVGQGLAATVAALPPVLGVLLAFCGVYYLMLVYAPRQLAVADGGLVAWAVRFAVFVAAEIVTVSWLAATA